jgi:hypothetical protein
MTRPISELTINEIKELLASKGISIPTSEVSPRSSLVYFAETALGQRHQTPFVLKRSPRRTVVPYPITYRRTRHLNAPKHVTPRHTGHHTYSKKQLRELMSSKTIRAFIRQTGHPIPRGLDKEGLVTYVYNLRI